MNRDPEGKDCLTVLPLSNKRRCAKRHHQKVNIIPNGYQKNKIT